MDSKLASIRDTYSSALGRIDDHIRLVNDALSWVRGDACTIFQTLGGSSDPSEGGFVDALVNAIELVKPKGTNVYGPTGSTELGDGLAAAKNLLVNQRGVVSNRLEYLRGKCNNEDITGEAFPVEDIVFWDEG